MYIVYRERSVIYEVTSGIFHRITQKYNFMHKERIGYREVLGKCRRLDNYNKKKIDVLAVLRRTLFRKSRMHESLRRNCRETYISNR